MSQQVAVIPKATDNPSPTSNRQLVAVYGTLKKGFANHYLISEHEDSAFKGTNVLSMYTMVSFGGFPAVCKNLSHKGTIVVEVWDVSDACLARLDMLEGHPDWYKRELVKVGSHEHVWIYLMPREKVIDKYPVVQHGNWGMVA